MKQNKQEQIIGNNRVFLLPPGVKRVYGYSEDETTRIKAIEINPNDLISQTRQEAVEDIKKLMIEDLLKHNSKTICWCGGCEDTGYNWAIQDVIELLSQEKK